MKVYYAVKCKSGLTGWRGLLQDVYSNYVVFKAYCGIWNLHKRFGYSSPLACWHDNPVIEGSTYPHDSGLAPKKSKLWKSNKR